MQRIGAEQLLENRGFLRALARSLLADPERADDVVQEACLAALKRPPRASVPLRSWLAAVVRNRAYRVGREEARRAKRERAAAQREWVRPAEDVIDAEAARQEVVRALLGLEEPYRTVLLLRYYDDLKPREIAERLGLPGPTVRTRLQRGLELLRGRLDAGRSSDRRSWCLALAPLAIAPARPSALAGIVAGGIAMKAKLAAVGLIVAALGLFLYTRYERAQPSRAACEPARGPVPAQTDATEGGPDALAQLPPPVDFDAIDLDLDVHGIVVRKEDGSPIAGAEVAMVDYPWRRAIVLNSAGYYEGAVGRSTSSAIDGTFIVRLRRGQLVGVRVRAEGFAPAEIPDVQAGERLRVELSPSTAFVVLVRDEAGRPVEGASVRCSAYAGRGDFEQTTDVGGLWTYRLSPNTASFVVQAWHPAHGSGRERVSGAESRVEVTLSRGRTISGGVTDAKSGAPIGGARLGMGWTFERAVEADAEGRYVLRGLPDKGGEILADAPTYGLQRRPVGESDVIDFHLEPGGSVVARVVGPSNEPLPGVYASAIASRVTGQEQEISHRHATTGPDGRLRLEGLRVDLRHRLVLMTPGYGRTLVEFMPRPPEEGPVDLGILIMPRGRAIEGTVLSGVGSAVQRTEVILKPVGRAPADFYGNTEVRRTDHLGRFRFPDQSPGSYTLEARPEGGVYATTDVDLGEADLLGIEIRLSGGREFAVVVQDFGGGPVRDAYITVEHGGGVARSRTDDKGRAVFAVDGRVRQVDCMVADRTFLPPKTMNPANQNEVRLVLSEAGRAKGRVLLPDGKPLPSALLEVRRGEERFSSCSTDERGEFEAAVPTDGAVDLVLAAIQRTTPVGTFFDTNMVYEGTLRGVSAGAENLVLRLQGQSPEGTLSVVILDLDGKPVAGVGLTVPVPADGAGSGQATTDGQGHALLTGLPVEEVTLSASGKLGTQMVAPAPVRIVPRGQEIVLRCRPGVSVSGVVVLPDGKPLVGSVQVTAGEGSGTVETTQTGEGGRFTLVVPKERTGGIRVFCYVTTSAGKNLWSEAELGPGQEEIQLQLKER